MTTATKTKPKTTTKGDPTMTKLNTVTVASIREYVDANIRVHARTIDALAAPLIGRLDELAAEISTELNHSHIAQELQAGQTFDAAAYSKRIREEALRHQLAVAERDLLQKSLMEMRQRRDWEPRETGDQELEYLNSQVVALAEDVRAIAKRWPTEITLDDVRVHPERAEGVAAQFDAVAAYEHIRERQLRIATSAGLTGVDDRLALAVTGRLKDALNREAYWLEARRDRVDEVEYHQNNCLPRQLLSDERVNFFTEAPTVPWQASTEPTRAFPDGAEPWAYLAWAATEAELWVPSLEELAEHHEYNREMVNLVTPPSRKPAVRRVYAADGSLM